MCQLGVNSFWVSCILRDFKENNSWVHTCYIISITTINHIWSTWNVMLWGTWISQKRFSKVAVFFTSEKCIYSIRVMKYTISLPFQSSPLDAGRRFVPSSLTQNLNWETDSPSRLFVALWGLQMQMLEYYLKKCYGGLFSCLTRWQS
jgi:hypothetical protein